MHSTLIKNAFQKAKKEIGSDKITHISKYLSDYIVNHSKEPYGEKSLRVNYNKLLENSDDKIYLKEHAAEALSHYLGFSNYADFIKNNSDEETTNPPKSQNFSKKNKLVVILFLVVISGVFVYNSVTKQRWMVWQEDHYIKVNFDTEKYRVNQLKLFKEERIELFKKVSPKCATEFFNEDKSVNVWYGKNKYKKLEYFTALGLHPETGKTLKPITQYMIDKYVCIK
ncbi:hypothetical protein [Psychroserpens jangbogonensis]|uniref:hypothetical protein n=1 Tax=Psychroserpens jangbogonensis TaxID=1484460 RepID=UPI00053D84F1|nr:hypothetical protein [Psychroserpens jangbogonensis]